MTTDTMNGHTNGTAKAATPELPLAKLRPVLSAEALEALDAIVQLSKIKGYPGQTPEQIAAAAAQAASQAIVGAHERLMGKLR